MFPTEFLAVMLWAIFLPLVIGAWLLRLWHLRGLMPTTTRFWQAAGLLTTLTVLMCIANLATGPTWLGHFLGIRDVRFLGFDTIWAPFAFVAVLLALPFAGWWTRQGQASLQSSIFGNARSRIFGCVNPKRAPEHANLFRAVLNSNFEEIRKTVAQGANPNARDHLGMTPLLYAVYRGDVQSVTILLEAGADPNLADARDPMCTPLWHAEEDFGLFEVARVLRAFGARL